MISQRAMFAHGVTEFFGGQFLCGRYRVWIGVLSHDFALLDGDGGK